MPISAKLVLAGMNVRAIADDPEQAAVLDEVVAAVRRLPHPERSRVHLVCLPWLKVKNSDGKSSARWWRFTETTTPIPPKKSKSLWL